MSSSKNFHMTIDPGEKWYLFSQSALDEMIENKVKAELEKAGITIPFPQRDVHMITEGPEA